MMMCISRSEVCSRFLAVWWCPKRIQKYRIPKYGLSEEAQAPKNHHHHHRHPTAREIRVVLFISIFYFSNFSNFSFYFSIVKNSC